MALLKKNMSPMLFFFEFRIPKDKINPKFKFYLSNIRYKIFKKLNVRYETFKIFERWFEFDIRNSKALHVFDIKHTKFEFRVEFEIRHSLFKRFKSWIKLYIRYLRYSKLEKYWLLSFYRFFEKRFLISQLISIHILFHI